ncbi:leader peptidase (prepilin peptidase)/N-methyltransferase [Saccharothrix variisporea]|uniref:Leader peptidase (Prepilin peptidase)/N-methyltransferase n=1 Tax=Saccharothrix variisporea TaxID=543527 RepID=A0A495X570_9PSEU|nr:leader peptidase (prepilin peptidase)/N-methyltransferase [Saccharothrix variisporea]
MTCATVTCALLALVAHRFADSPEQPAMCWFAVISVRLAQIDLASRRLPHVLVGSLGLGGVLLLTWAALVEDDVGALLRGLAAAAVLFVGLHSAPARGGVGGGDANLLAAVGLYLGHAGWDQVARGLVTAIGLAGGTSLALVLLRRISTRDPIAVGPAILGGALITLTSD